MEFFEKSKAKAIMKSVLTVSMVFSAFVYSCAILNFLLVPNLRNQVQVNYAEMLLYDNIEVAILGDSASYLSFNTPLISNALGQFFFNASISQASFKDTYFLLEKLYENNDPDVVFIDVSLSRFYNNFDSLSQYLHPRGMQELFPFLAYRENIFKPANIFKNVKDKTHKNKSAQTDKVFVGDRPTYSKGFGYWEVYTSMEYGNAGAYTDIREYYNITFNENKICQNQLQYLYNTFDLIKNNNSGTRIILYSTAWHLAWLGQNAHTYNAYLDFVRNMGYEFYDFNLLKKEYFERNDTIFHDFVHVTNKGSFKFSGFFTEFYKNVVQGGEDANTYLWNNIEEVFSDNKSVYSTKLTYNNKERQFKASSNSGANIELEYQFQISHNGGYYRTVKDFSSEDFLPLKALPSGNIGVRVNVRVKENNVDFEQYATMQYRN